MPRVLDELAEAFHRGRGGPVPRVVVTSTALADQFGGPVTPARWVALRRRLWCLLPPLEGSAKTGWSVPAECATVWDLADHVAADRPEWQPPAERTARAWREAQIFIGVRAVLVEAGNLDPEKIERPARLTDDLRLE
jgi:hypothetical protein